jgi:hypothetical protein
VSCLDANIGCLDLYGTCNKEKAAALFKEVNEGKTRELHDDKNVRECGWLLQEFVRLVPHGFLPPDPVFGVNADVAASLLYKLNLHQFHTLLLVFSHLYKLVTLSGISPVQVAQIFPELQDFIPLLPDKLFEELFNEVYLQRKELAILPKGAKANGFGYLVFANQVKLRIACCR